MLGELVGHKASDGLLVVGIWVLVRSGLGANCANDLCWIHCGRQRVVMVMVV